MGSVRIRATVTCVWPVGAILGEGPCWDARCGNLIFLDIKGLKIHAYTPVTGARRSWDVPSRVCSLAVPGAGWDAPADFGDMPYLCCGDTGLAWLSLDTATPRLRPIANPEAHLPENRFNDGKIGPDGRYWAGTMHDPETTATGTLYAFKPGGLSDALDSGYRVTNGPAFSLDGRTVYHNDSALQSVYAFDLEADGSLVNRRVLAQFQDGEGYPDGMTTDAEGNLWIAMWDGWRIEKISPRGERLGVVEMPTARTTSCAFGADARMLFATSASIGLEPAGRLDGGLMQIVLS